jgi:hypothetical protein
MPVMNLATLLGKQQFLLSRRNTLAFALMSFADMLHSSRSFACLFPCVNVIKLFASVTHNLDKKARVFVPGVLLQSSSMFETTARSGASESWEGFNPVHEILLGWRNTLAYFEVA